MNEKRDQEKDVGLYEKILARTAELLESGRKNFDEALKKAEEELHAGGDFTREQIERVRQFVKRDLRHQTEKAQEAIRQSVNPQRLNSGAQSAFARILAVTGKALSDLAEKAEKQLEFRTGELTSPGTLTCRGCETEMHFTATVRIPPCPKCHKTVFRKSY